MGYFQVRYNSRVVNYDRIGFIRLATGVPRKQLLYHRAFLADDAEQYHPKWKTVVPKNVRRILMLLLNFATLLLELHDQGF